uniref:Uncharacterized protein n=1 Tax=Leersia perrieri TaxID=77586 RepID=A0A0D9XW38_9ORYZ
MGRARKLSILPLPSLFSLSLLFLVPIPKDTAAEDSTRRSQSGSRSDEPEEPIVNVNSLFTLAAFIGLAWRPFASPTAPTAFACFHVLAFACFLFSSIVALCLKQIVRTYPSQHYPRRSFGSAATSRTARINRAALRVGIVASAVGSMCGCGFLMMALVNVVQVKLSRLRCGAGGGAAWGAVVPLVTLVPTAMLLIYIGIVFYAFTR